MEIEFRAWDEFEKTFITTEICGNNLNFFTAHQIFSLSRITSDIEQYTNSKDVDRKKIFAGDRVDAIINGIGSPIPYDFSGVVEFMESGFFVVNEELQLAFPVFQEIDQWKITGNIHEN